MVLAGASEFDPQYNKDATSRPTDNILIPQVRPIAQIPWYKHLGIKVNAFLGIFFNNYFIYSS